MITNSSPQMKQRIKYFVLTLGTYGFIKVDVSQPLIIPDSGDKGIRFLPKTADSVRRCFTFPLQTPLLTYFLPFQKLALKLTYIARTAKYSETNFAKVKVPTSLHAALTAMTAASAAGLSFNVGGCLSTQEFSAAT